jgi:pimeloyl-ACP methyl ester carboxylesterase
MQRFSFRRRAAVLALACLLVAAGALPHSDLAGAWQDATPASSARGSAGQLDWTACAGVAAWECATLTVPLDYAQPDGETLDLAVTRLPAADPAQRIGVLLLNCGGPGCPAVGFLHSIGSFIFPQEMLDRFDLVGWDARGVGASGQLDCQPDYAAWYDLDPSPDDAAEQAAWLAAGEAFAQACAANGGAVLAHMGTENVTSDMERLREALGEETISFLGLSYGTSLGARYADRYPERVRAFALDSGLPSFTDPLTFVPEWVDGIERAFNAFLAECAATTACAFHAGGDPGAAFDQLMADLDAAPLAVETEHGLREAGQHAVMDAVDVTLSKPGRWPELAGALAAAAAGDGAPVLALADQHNERNPDGSYGPGNTVFLAVGCLDFPITRDPAAYLALAEKAAQVAPRTGAYYATWTLPCVFWPAPATPASHAPVAAGAPPILVVGALLDTQDAYQWSVEMAASLESGVLLRHDGTGHPSYFTSACVEDAVNAYLLGLSLPAPDLVCTSGNGLFDRLR